MRLIACLAFVCLSGAVLAQPESSIGTYPVPAIIGNETFGYATGMSGADPFSLVIGVDQQATYDPTDVLFFALLFPDGGRAVLTIDADLSLSRELARLARSPKQKVRLVLDPLVPERLAR